MTTLALAVMIPPAWWMTQNRTIPNHRVRRRKVGEIHTLTVAAARSQHLTQVPTPAHALWTIHYPKGTGNADPVNAAPTTKAILDALVGRWLVADDSKHITRESFQRGPNLTIPGDHLVALELTPLEAP